MRFFMYHNMPYIKMPSTRVLVKKSRDNYTHYGYIKKAEYDQKVARFVFFPITLITKHIILLKITKVLRHSKHREVTLINLVSHKFGPTKPDGLTKLECNV